MNVEYDVCLGISLCIDLVFPRLQASLMTGGSKANLRKDSATP
jgi:hypothetical protein